MAEDKKARLAKRKELLAKLTAKSGDWADEKRKSPEYQEDVATRSNIKEGGELLDKVADLYLQAEKNSEFTMPEQDVAGVTLPEMTLSPMAGTTKAARKLGKNLTSPAQRRVKKGKEGIKDFIDERRMERDIEEVMDRTPPQAAKADPFGEDLLDKILREKKNAELARK